jgi:phosphatidylethanolamine-binding protein (PEBP) family uncharacterized protein
MLARGADYAFTMSDMYASTAAIVARSRVALKSRYAGVCALSAATALIVLAGCGSSGPAHARSSAATAGSSATGAAAAPSSTPAAPSSTPGGKTARTHGASIAVDTPARLGDNVVAARYTCRGSNVSPPLMWSPAPTGTEELVIMVRTLARPPLITNWAVAGLSPALTEIRRGHLPTGAIVGRNSFGNVGYSLCPPAGKSVIVTMAVYAFPHRLHLKEGFDPAKLTGALDEVPWGSVAMLGE